jgi:hypothetical protein
MTTKVSLGADVAVSARERRLPSPAEGQQTDCARPAASYEYMNAGDADLDRERGPLAGRIQGDYQSNDFHFFNVNFGWRF